MPGASPIGLSAYRSYSDELPHPDLAEEGGDVVVPEAGAGGQGHELLGAENRAILRSHGRRLNFQAQDCVRAAYGHFVADLARAVSPAAPLEIAAL